MTTVQEACMTLLEQENNLTFLSDEERRTFCITLAKVLNWAHARVDEVLDKMIKELE